MFPHRRPGEGRDNLKESYPQYIRYTTSPRSGDFCEYEIHFDVQAKDKDIKCQGDRWSCTRIADTGYILKAIEVRYQKQAGAAKGADPAL